jgi:hypothetical protein
MRAVITPSVAPRPPGIRISNPARVDVAKIKTDDGIEMGTPNPIIARYRHRHSKNHEITENKEPTTMGPDQIEPGSIESICQTWEETSQSWKRDIHLKMRSVHCGV